MDKPKKIRIALPATPERFLSPGWGIVADLAYIHAIVATGLHFLAMPIKKRDLGPVVRWKNKKNNAEDFLDD